MNKETIIACDFPSATECLNFLKPLQTYSPYVKIGMELFYAEGPEIVRQLSGEGYRIFLDLKLHDIPNTVESAMRVISSLGVKLTNVHAAGGIEMMQAAREGLHAGGGDTQLIAVTQLTSTSEQQMQQQLLIPSPLTEVVSHYASNAQAAGLDGVVCSPHEVRLVKERCSADFLCVTPGIRFADGERGDQQRVTTPEEARRIGSDYIVVGRPITRAADPVAAYLRCQEALQSPVH